jgi:aryl-alcohol dehydrogenase-like predicted oxidoreductase
MDTIELGTSGLRAGRIGLGTWAIGGWMWGGSDTDESIRTIRSALDRGINLVDTAPAYGFGRSEEIVGEAIRQSGRRDQVVIATKVGLRWDDGRRIARDSSATRIRQEIDDSLRRLRTDHVDVYQVHWPDPAVPVEETARAMGELCAAGKIRAIGVSNFSPAQMDAFAKVAPIHTSQPPYNVLERDRERDVLPYTERNGITTLAYGALCRGLLSGKLSLRTTFAGDDLRHADPKFQPPRFAEYLAAVDALERFARERYNKGVLALAVRFILDRGHTVALWGARHPAQLDPVPEVMGWSLDAEAMRRVDEILAEYVRHPVGPEFMAPRAA